MKTSTSLGATGKEGRFYMTEGSTSLKPQGSDKRKGKGLSDVYEQGEVLQFGYNVRIEKRTSHPYHPSFWPGLKEL